MAWEIYRNEFEINGIRFKSSYSEYLTNADIVQMLSASGGSTRLNHDLGIIEEGSSWFACLPDDPDSADPYSETMWSDTMTLRKTSRSRAIGIQFYTKVNNNWINFGSVRSSGSDIKPLYRRYAFICVNEETQEMTFLLNELGDRYLYGCDNRFTAAYRRELYELIKNGEIPEFTLRSLRYVDSKAGTLWLTYIPEIFINNAEYAEGINTEWFTPEARSNYNQMTHKKIIEVETAELSGYVEYIPYNQSTLTPASMLMYYKSGDTIIIASQIMDQFNAPVSVTYFEEYLSIYEDSDNEVATFALNGLDRVGGLFFSDNSYVNINSSAKTTLTALAGEALYKIIHAIPSPSSDPGDPYSNLEPAGPEGGLGDNSSSDPNDLTSLPPSLAADIGFLSLFTPTEAEVKELASYMWTDDLFDIANFKKIFADPMDCILGFLAYPFEVNRSGIADLVVGNMTTDVRMHVAASEFQDVDMGYQYIPQEYKSFLDYSPYTKLFVYLPFCGEHQLDIDRFAGKTVSITYRVNLLTGACVAILRDVDLNSGSYTSVLGQYNGNMSYSIPLTSTNYQQAISSIISLTATGIGLATGSPLGGAMAGSTIANVAQNVASMKAANVENGGSFASSIGSVCHLAPYFRLVKPRLVNSAGKNDIIGTPSMVTMQLNELTGYVEVQNIHLSSDVATYSELSELENLLKGGVIIEDLPLPE